MKRFVLLVALFCLTSLTFAKLPTPQLFLQLSDQAADQARYSRIPPQFMQNAQLAGARVEPIFYEPKKSENRRIWRELGMNRWYKLVGSHIAGEVLAKQLEKSAELTDFYLSYPKETNAVPNDFSNYDMWGLTQMMCPEAWDICHHNTARADIIITTIDTGCKIQHPDLAGNMRVNPGEDIDHDGLWTEADNNGIDDDGNGFIDDLVGWDFVSHTAEEAGLHPADEEDYAPRDNMIYPDFNGHGTHVAGTSAAVTNNDEGVAAASWNIKNMPLRAGFGAFDEEWQLTGWGEDDDFAAAIQYAADNGSNIISISFGGYDVAEAVYQVAVDYARALHVLIFASAGNDNTTDPHYPSDLNGVLSVAATAADDIKASFSNYGSGIDLSAPGYHIWSTMARNVYHDADYMRYNGTSMATPNAAAVAALIWSCNPCMNDSGVKIALLRGCDNIDAANPEYAGQLGAGRVNALRGLLLADSLKAIRGLFATVTRCDSIILSWTPQHYIDSVLIYRDGQYSGKAPAMQGRYADEPLFPGLYEYYLVPARCDTGTAATHTVGIMPAPTLPVEHVYASKNSCDSVFVHWESQVLAEHFLVLRDTTQIAVVNPNITHWVDYPSSGTYIYTVLAQNICGNSPARSDTGRRLPPLPAFAAFAATDNRCDSVILTWSQSFADSIQILRNNLRLGVVPGTRSRFADYPAAGNYGYTLRAFDACGMTAISDSGRRMQVTTISNFSASDFRCDSVVMAWSLNQPTDSIQIQENGRRIAVLPGSATHFAYVPSVGAYNYVVRAFNTCGMTFAGDVGHRWMPTLQPIANLTASDARCDSVIITWTQPLDADSVHVLRNGIPLTNLSIYSGNRFADAPPRGTYQYTVQSFNPCAISPAVSDSGRVWGVPVLDGVYATDDRCDSLMVSWHFSYPFADSVQILRNGVSMAVLPGSVTYLADNPSNGGYRYDVTPFNRCGAGLMRWDSGHVQPMVTLARFAQNYLCETPVRITATHCGGAQTDSVFLRVGAQGDWMLSRVNSPVRDADTVFIPRIQVRSIDSCLVKVVSARGPRRDAVYSQLFTILCPNAAVDPNETGVVTDYFLSQNYPNPFNPSTTITYGLPRETDISLEIFDVTGRRVTVLASGLQNAGVHRAVWDCAGCPSGMYLIRLQSRERTLLVKSLLMK